MTKLRISSQEKQLLKLYTKLMRASNFVTEKLHDHLIEYQLSLSQFGVIEALYHLGPLCQKEIGNKILKTSGNMTLVIDNLEKQGLVKRKPDKKDRRRVSVHLTRDGEKKIEQVFPIVAQKANHVFSVISASEQKTLGLLLKKLGLAATT